MNSRILAAALLTAGGAAPLTAESYESSAIQPQSRSTAAADAFARFAPAADTTDRQIDYRHWDEALNWLVLPMGPSIREGARRVEPLTGSRRIYGHQSRYRLEGNRIGFSFIDAKILTGLTEYREDLERVGSTLDIARLPRNEQLAFWLNLHNVAVIEALAHEYPLKDPSERAFGANDAALDEAKLVSIAGVQLSPRDIRERIVYPNWQDPKVMYGFWRGVIGGPSIQRIAFNAQNVDTLLSIAAEEFVNSLRGIEQAGGEVRISPIYREGAPFFFDGNKSVRAHLTQYARDDVKALINSGLPVGYNSYETMLADIAGGDNDPGINNLFVQGGGGVGPFAEVVDVNALGATAARTIPDSGIVRLINERRVKLIRAHRRGIRTGTVIFGDGVPAGSEPREVR